MVEHHSLNNYKIITYRKDPQRVPPTLPDGIGGARVLPWRKTTCQGQFETCLLGRQAQGCSVSNGPCRDKENEGNWEYVMIIIIIIYYYYLICYHFHSNRVFNASFYIIRMVMKYCARMYTCYRGLEGITDTSHDSVSRTCPRSTAAVVCSSTHVGLLLLLLPFAWLHT